MADDVYQVSFLGVIAMQPAANVLHFKGAESGGTDPVDAAKDLVIALGTPPAMDSYVHHYLACLPANYTLRALRARRINNGGGPNVTALIEDGVGSRTGNASLSGPAAVALYHTTNGSGSWRTGKVFLPGISVEDVIANQLDPGLITAIEQFISLHDDTIGSGPTGPFGQVVWSEKDSAAMTILAGSVSAKIGTQRKRYVPI